jgi:hypothetical protein
MWHQRRRVEAGKFLELTMKVRVLQRFAEFAGKNLIRSRNDDLIGVA